MKDRFETFTVLISKISRSIRRIKTEYMKVHNLKSPHVSCLYHLCKAQDNALTAKELCELCDEDKAAISRSIESLETNGYICCESSLKKRYRSPLTLTAKGNEIAQGLEKKIDSVLSEASMGLSEQNRIILYKSLALISDNLQKISIKNGEE